MIESQGSFSRFGGDDLKDDLNPIEEAQALAEVWAKTLENTGLIYVIEKRVAVNQVHLLGRVKTEDEREMVHGPISRMLDVTSWDFLHFGKVYLKKNGKLMYGWEFSAGKDNLPSLIKDLCNAVDEYNYDEGYKGSDDVERDIEVPLLGQQAPQGSLTSGRKGAQPLRG